MTIYTSDLLGLWTRKVDTRTKLHTFPLAPFVLSLSKGEYEEPKVKRSSSPSFKPLFAALLALGLAACAATGPSYQAPAKPEIKLQNAALADFTAAQIEHNWWAQLEDPVLSDLIDKARAANHDIRIAMARMQAARAQFNVAELDRLPTVTANAAANRGRAQQPGVTTERVFTSSYRTGFDASWELDLWGRVARLEDAAHARADAAEVGVEQARISISAEVARNYYLLRGAQQRLAVANRNLQNLQATRKITSARVADGRGTDLDRARAEANLAATQATLPPLETEIKRYQYHLAVLTGAMPGTLDASLQAASLPPIAKALPIGDTSNLLRRRPDIAIAERELAASSADLAASSAERFPRISLGGFIGFLAGRGGDLGQIGSRAWGFSPSVDWPAFRLGTVEARIRAGRADAEDKLATYEQAVLQAVEETEDALIGYSKQQQRLARLVEAAQQSKRAADIARVRYKEGATDFLTLLDAERTQLQAEDAMAQAESQAYVELVGVYKALGGGWNVGGEVALR